MNVKDLQEALEYTAKEWIEDSKKITDADVQTLLKRRIFMNDGSSTDSEGQKFKYLSLYFHTYDEQELENIRNMILLFTKSRNPPILKS